MIEHIYSIRKSSWWINIKIIAQIENYQNTNIKDEINVIKVAEGIWLKYADKPLMENEIFCDEYLSYFLVGLKIVQTEIKNNSLYADNLIVINSVQFNPSDFQEEGLTAAIVEWASKAFHFQAPIINVKFDKIRNLLVER